MKQQPMLTASSTPESEQLPCTALFHPASAHKGGLPMSLFYK